MKKTKTLGDVIDFNIINEGTAIAKKILLFAENFSEESQDEVADQLMTIVFALHIIAYSREDVAKFCTVAMTIRDMIIEETKVTFLENKRKEKH